MTAGKVDAGKILRYFAYFMSAVFFFGGLFVIFGVFISDNVPKQLRITFGIVLMLWAIYRLVIIRTKSKRYEEDE